MNTIVYLPKSVKLQNSCQIITLVSQISARESGECFQEEGSNLVIEKLTKLELIDNLKELEFNLDSTEECSLAKSLTYIKGDK